MAEHGRRSASPTWRLALRWVVISGCVTATSAFLVVAGALFTSGLSGSHANDIGNRARSAVFMGAGVALLGLIPWLAADEGVRGPWRAVAFLLVAGGGVLALATITGVTVPN